ncbi:MAG: DUF1287 domain-containing protein [Phycisphaerae bacterium]
MQPWRNIVGWALCGIALSLAGSGCHGRSQGAASRGGGAASSPADAAATFPATGTRPATNQAAKIVLAARAQVGRTTVYDPAYVRLAYPGGDVPVEKGVCADVVVRALRDALDLDLQKLVHEDMEKAFPEYPRKWGLRQPDSNIDHRRVLNLMKYFDRAGCSRPVTSSADDYAPGDIVTCTVPPNLPHVMIVSDRATPEGAPYVIHNIGRGAKEEARLFEFPITGHYRLERQSGQ